MLTRLLFVGGLVLCGIVVLTGAWPGSFASNPPSTETNFVPKTVLIDVAIVGSDVDADSLLKKALAKLENDDAVWMNTKIRQTMQDGQVSFVAEGTLQRGPNQCARLELDVTTRGVRSHVTTVCDGQTIAQVHKLPGAKPSAEVLKLPALTEAMPPPIRAAREDVLTDKSCGGPIAVLRSIEQHLRGATLQTGLLGETPVIQLNGDIDPAKLPIFAALNLKSLHAHVYLDAGTLWPRRIEWWGADKGPKRQLMAIEFRDPIVGVPLSHEECEQMFSYRPDGDEHVTEQ